MVSVQHAADDTLSRLSDSGAGRNRMAYRSGWPGPSSLSPDAPPRLTGFQAHRSRPVDLDYPATENAYEAAIVLAETMLAFRESETEGTSRKRLRCAQSYSEAPAIRLCCSQYTWAVRCSNGPEAYYTFASILATKLGVLFAMRVQRNQLPAHHHRKPAVDHPSSCSQTESGEGF